MNFHSPLYFLPQKMEKPSQITETQSFLAYSSPSTAALPFSHCSLLH